MKRRCPTCGRSTASVSEHGERYFPFCSERCQLIDLGKWFDERYRIPTELTLDGGTAIPDSGDETSLPPSLGR